MLYSGILRRVVLVRTDDSEERSASIITVTRNGELGTMLEVTTNCYLYDCNATFLRNVGSYKSHIA
jgi:hypothetical protein